MALQMSVNNGRKKLLRFGEDDGEENRVKYYSSHHQILLVGEGDFSFSLCLAQSFGSAFNIVASSLDTCDQVLRKYKKAGSNLVALTKLGADVWHGVDATQMTFHPYLKMRRFDRIIFNFPHAGFHGKEANFSMILKHRNLIRGFFMNARSMLTSNGEIHVNHKTTPPFDDWRIEELGIQSFLWPIECVEFRKEDYPGYNNKRGDGSKCDEPFHLGKCSTFKFAILTKKESNYRNQRILSNYHYPLRSLLNPHSPPSVTSCRNEHLPMSVRRGYLNNELEILEGAGSCYFDGANCGLHRSSWPKSTETRHAETGHVRDMDMFGERYVSVYVHGISSDLLRRSWPESTVLKYQETEFVRDMDMIKGRPVSENVYGISSDLLRRSWPKFSNDIYLNTDKIRDEYDNVLEPYHAASWF